VVDQTLEIPSDVHYVGIWDAENRLEAAAGNIVVAGHVNYYDQGPGALSPLSEVERGALVYLTGSGVRTAWRVASLEVFTKSALPPATFSTTGPRQLVLITCGGPFDPRNGSYLDNVVVTAVPVAEGGPVQ
jgi:sortase (surface protein transpeptidase)